MFSFFVFFLYNSFDRSFFPFCSLFPPFIKRYKKGKGGVYGYSYKKVKMKKIGGNLEQNRTFQISPSVSFFRKGVPFSPLTNNQPSLSRRRFHHRFLPLPQRHYHHHRIQHQSPIVVCE